MKFMSRASFRQALIINQGPIWLLTVAALVVTGFVLAEVDVRADALTQRVMEQDSAQDVIVGIASDVRLFWLVLFTVFLISAAFASALSLWVYGQVARRIDRIVAYARASANGEDLPPLEPMSSDAIGQLEHAIIDITQTIRRRDEQLRRETQHSRFDADLHQAFDYVATESKVLEIVGQAITTVLPNHASEVLMADSSQANLTRVDEGQADSPGCAVVSLMECPAIRLNQQLSFGSSEKLSACPYLRGRDGGACSAVCTPLTVAGQGVGVVHITGADGTLPGPEESRLLEATARHTGTRLTMLRTLETSQVQAQTDPLTGLLNRRSFEEKVIRVLRGSGGKTHSVVMCDLDHFKRLNDTAGHAAGDRALKLFSQTLRSNVRPDDVIGRHGGEEFVILLADCKAQDARTILNRVRARLAISSQRYDGPSFTASFGVASFPDCGVELADLIRSADGALYEAKRSGRDRVVTTQDGVSPPPPADRPPLRTVATAGS